MSNAPSPPHPQQSWKELVEIVIFETDPDDLSQRIQDAPDAIMDEIEDSFQTASSSDRQSLINAVNSTDAAQLCPDGFAVTKNRSRSDSLLTEFRIKFRY